ADRLAARNDVRVQIDPRRRGLGGLQYLADEITERVVARGEVRLDVHFDNRRALAVGGDARAHFALAPDHARFLGALREPLLQAGLDRPLHVARGLGERALAVAHPGLGSLTKLFDRLRVDRSHDSLSPSRRLTRPTSTRALVDLGLLPHRPSALAAAAFSFGT